MLLLKTSFYLQKNLDWNTIYKDCILPWIKGSENRKTKQKNYEKLLKILPAEIDFQKKPMNTFKSENDSLEYSSFDFNHENFLGFNFIYSSQNRQWNVRIVFKRSTEHLYCCVSVSCEVDQSTNIPSISKPRIIDYLMNYQEEKGDSGIQIDATPHLINNADVQTAINILKGNKNNKLPIVYLSCYEHHALQPQKVAKNLYGIAHVYAETDKHLSDRIAIDVKHPFPRGGEIAICYPKKSPIIINRRSNEKWANDPKTLTQDIFHKILIQNIAIKAEFSWDDYQTAYTAYLRKTKENQKALLESIEKARDTAKEELNTFIENFDKDNEGLRTKINDLKNENELLKKKNQEEKNAREAAESNIKSLKEKSGPYFPLYIPNEQEKYENEYLNHIICALKMALPKGKGKNASNRQRNLDVWQAILDANPEATKKYDDYYKDKNELLRIAKAEDLKGHQGQKMMKKFNLEFIRKENNHGKIQYINDDRYIATESSTSSDSARGGENGASALERALFCSHK